MPLTAKQCSSAVSSLPPYSFMVPSSIRHQNIIAPDRLMDIPVNPTWEYSVHQVTKSKATMHASDMHPTSAIFAHIFGLGLSGAERLQFLKLLCVSTLTETLDPAVSTSAAEVGAAGEKAEASSGDPVGLRDSSQSEFKRSFRNIALQWGPVEVKHKPPIHFSEIRIIPIPSACKYPALKYPILSPVRNPEECDAVNNSHALPKWSRAVKQCVLIALLTSPGAAGVIFPEDCSKVLIY